MDKFKNFQGKTLDEAILEACGHYGVPREKLEIEIVNDAKSGIFGLVGVKKAEIRAARMQVAETLSAMLEDADAGSDARTPPPADAPAPAEGRWGRHSRAPRVAGYAADSGVPSGQKTGRAASPLRGPAGRGAPAGHEAKRGTPSPPAPADKGISSVPEAERAGLPVRNGVDGPSRPRRAGSDSSGQAERAERDAFSASAAEEPYPPRSLRGGYGPDTAPPDNENSEYDAWSRASAPEFDPASLDPAQLTDIVSSVVVGLAAPIVGEVSCRVEIGERWVRAVLDCGDNAGLLVGREGQTLAALQYLAGRLAAGKLGASLRLQVDAGHYLEHREDRLRELALALAEKVKATRRAQATRPLSAYQRRIVHLALENDPDVLTHSKGEGLQRRVYIYLKNAAGNSAPAGARFAGHARPSGRDFPTGRTRFADTPSGATDADGTPATDNAGDPDGPDPWNR
ncbi:MAG: Jag N-terminal domain-containing protein [Desulfovibrio sp.]|jgi:spoIIIJ-associated protein|nr:Jag N-terminal domain-containing protein [Desulfovibrio sp.]